MENTIALDEIKVSVPLTSIACMTAGLSFIAIGILLALAEEE